MGLHRAGFEVIGVDLKPQPNYPFAFVQGDALNPPFRLSDFDLIWASPPCQAFTAYRRRPDHVGPSPDLVDETRQLVRSGKRPYIIENVRGAGLPPLRLCGSMFGLEVRRHRYFETSFLALQPPCAHHTQNGSHPPATNRSNPRRTVEIGVWRIPVETQRRAMGIDWPMTREELSQAIPPAYSEHLATAALL